MPREFELATCQFECDTLTYWAIWNTLYSKWQSYRGIRETFLLVKGVGHFENYVDLSMLFLQHLNWNLLAFSHFDFEQYLWKKYCKGFQNSKIINSIKTDFSEYFPSPCVFQFSVYIHSLHSQEYSYFHET